MEARKQAELTARHARAAPANATRKHRFVWEERRTAARTKAVVLSLPDPYPAAVKQRRPGARMLAAALLGLALGALPLPQRPAARAPDPHPVPAQPIVEEAPSTEPIERPVAPAARRVPSRGRTDVLHAGLLGGPPPDSGAAGLGSEIDAALDALASGAAEGVGRLALAPRESEYAVARNLGLGELGTRGGGRGTGGYGSIDLGGRGHGSTRIIPGVVTVVGGLPRDVIGKIVRRHWNQIKYCYEDALQRSPGMQGKVALQFVIDGSGAVAQVAVADDTLPSREVGACMKRMVSAWKFPAAPGGTQTVATYPWIFRSAGEEP